MNALIRLMSVVVACSGLVAGTSAMERGSMSMEYTLDHKDTQHWYCHEKFEIAKTEKDIAISVCQQSGNEFVVKKLSVGAGLVLSLLQVFKDTNNKPYLYVFGDEHRNIIHFSDIVRSNSRQFVSDVVDEERLWKFQKAINDMYLSDAIRAPEGTLIGMKYHYDPFRPMVYKDGFIHVPVKFKGKEDVLQCTSEDIHKISISFKEMVPHQSKFFCSPNDIEVSIAQDCVRYDSAELKKFIQKRFCEEIERMRSISFEQVKKKQKILE
jgi:hypothetical protein